METILTEKSNTGVRICTFNRPEKRNAISRQLLRECREFLSEIQSDSQARALILTGNGPAFCAGADLKERSSMSELEVREFLSNFRQFLLDLEHLSIPTLTVFNGDAYGGGLEISLATDFRFLKEGSRLGLTETRLGIIPGAGGTQRLPRIVGIPTAKEWILTGRKLDSVEALNKGLVNSVSSDPMKDAEELILEILDCAPLSVGWAKMAIQEGADLDLDSALDVEQKYYQMTLATKDRLEALNAFQEKRKPNFRAE